MNLRVTAAVGMAIPIAPNPTWHCRLVPKGYVVVTVDDVKQDFEELKLTTLQGKIGS
jgi:hypothetical protein